jgi:PTH1 family peptidyl-tRNA hydrolase
VYLLGFLCIVLLGFSCPRFCSLLRFLPLVSRWLPYTMRLPPPTGTRRFLIVGLGNPGPMFAATRHNAGSFLVGRLATRFGVRLACERDLFAEAAIAPHGNDVELVLANPTTFMNDSGRSVSRLLRAYGVVPSHLFVLHDELDLPLGVTKVKVGGSANGHNGLKSLISDLGSADFPRLRFGVGRPSSGSVPGYVLSRFAASESALLPGFADAALDVLLNRLLLSSPSRIGLS